MVIRANAQSIPTLLVLRKQFLETRPRSAPLTDQELQTMPHPQCVAVLHTAGGYALFHLGEWEHQPVLWMDELFLQPAARKQGLLKEFVDWVRGYCEYNGISTVMGMAFSFEEGLPLKTHTTAKPVAQILQVPVSELYYRPSEQQVNAAPVPIVEPVQRRPRKRKTKDPYTPEQLRQLREPTEIRTYQEPPAQQAASYQSNNTLEHRAGVPLPLPLSPERM